MDIVCNKKMGSNIPHDKAKQDPHPKDEQINGGYPCPFLKTQTEDVTVKQVPLTK